MQNNIYKRVARAEAMANMQRSELEEVLKASYDRACADKNAEEAADFARKIRNKLLAASDKEVAFDRLNLDTSSATAFLRSMKDLFGGGWSEYRKQLRDLPDQPGFPFKIDWPHTPDEEKEG